MGSILLIISRKIGKILVSEEGNDSGKAIYDPERGFVPSCSVYAYCLQLFTIQQKTLFALTYMCVLYFFVVSLKITDKGKGKR